MESASQRSAASSTEADTLEASPDRLLDRVSASLVLLAIRPGNAESLSDIGLAHVALVRRALAQRDAMDLARAMYEGEG